MKWDPSHESGDLEDRRGESAPSRGGVGGLGLLFSLFARFGWPGLAVGGVILAVSYGANTCGGSDDGPSTRGPTQTSSSSSQQRRPAEEDKLVKFVAYVFDDAQTFWRQTAQGYSPAKLVAFTGATRTGCGYGDAAVGPFYCPLDQKVYIDVGFYRVLKDKLGAPGDFAQAYVIAHEVGHHVQRLTGVLREDKGSSVQIELQADCLAGAWAQSAEKRDLLEVGDLDEAMRAAASVGDDEIQRKQTGRVRPETFTHGSAADRQNAFQRGYRGGAAACGLPGTQHAPR